MPSLSIRPVTFAEIEKSPAAPRLFAEYAAESAITELGTPKPDAAYYASLEAGGALFGFGAFLDDELVGFFMLLVAHVPHGVSGACGTRLPVGGLIIYMAGFIPTKKNINRFLKSVGYVCAWVGLKGKSLQHMSQMGDIRG